LLPVLQQPSRYTPVIGFVPHTIKGLLKTFTALLIGFMERFCFNDFDNNK
jgi:hypothetical protein